MPRPNAPTTERARAEVLAPFVREDVLAMEAGAFDRLLQHPEAFASWFDDEDEPDDCPYDVKDGVAVITVRGALAQRGGRFWCWSWPGYDTLAQDLGRALDDTNVRAVLFAIDSPGGVVAGCFDAVRAMRDRVEASGKPVVAVADEHCYSAAYALACVADEIVVPQTGGVGSVGVIATMTSVSRMYAEAGIDVTVVTSGSEKADGHPALPLSKEAVTRAQERVTAFAEVFIGWVAERRGMKPEAVAALQAGIRMGEAAIAAGLADRSATLAATLAELVTRVALKPSTPGPFTGLLPSHSTATRPAMLLILAALSVATEAEAVTSINSLLDLRRQTQALTGAGADSEALGTLHAWKRDAASAGELRAQIEADRAARVATERKELIASAVASMRLTPAEASNDGQPEAWTTALNNDGLRAFIARASGPVSGDKRQPVKGAPSAGSLTDEQRALADQLGLDHAAYAASLAAAG